MKGTDSFNQAIKAYIEERAKVDELFAQKFTNPKKSIDECCNYILGEARKRGNAVAMSEAEVYGMAVHYYDEDDIKVNKISANVKASVSNLAPSAKVQQVQKSEPVKSAPERKPKQSKREEDPRQMSLF